MGRFLLQKNILLDYKIVLFRQFYFVYLFKKKKHSTLKFRLMVIWYDLIIKSDCVCKLVLKTSFRIFFGYLYTD